MRAILYSPGFGGGYVSWNPAEYAPFLISYEPFVRAIESDRQPDAEEIEQLFKDLRKWLGKDENDESVIPWVPSDALCIEYVEDDEQVMIEEYDGYESVRIRSRKDGWY